MIAIYFFSLCFLEIGKVEDSRQFLNTVNVFIGVLVKSRYDENLII